MQQLGPLATMEVHVLMTKMVFSHVNVGRVLQEVTVKQTSMIVPKAPVNMEQFVMIVLPITVVLVRRDSLVQTVT